MKEFNLSEWLQDKSRKVVTRSGHNVRIICTDQRGNMPIVALVEFEKLDGVQIFYPDGKNESHCEYDLFFADEEEEMNEFETRIYNLINFSDPYNYPSIKEVKEEAEILLDLARKKLEPELDKKLKEAYNQGGLDTQEEITKCLPKWKKSSEHKDFQEHLAILEDNKVLLTDYLEEGDYYIVLNELKTLPKEE